MTPAIDEPDSALACSETANREFQGKFRLEDGRLRADGTTLAEGKEMVGTLTIDSESITLEGYKSGWLGWKRVHWQRPLSRIADVARDDLAIWFTILPVGNRQALAESIANAVGLSGVSPADKCTARAAFMAANSDEADALVAVLPRTHTPAAIEAADFSTRLDAVCPGVWATPLLIGLNVFMFLLMAIFGAGLISPSSEALVRWGANSGPLTTAGQWWRVVTCCFVHVGFVHLAFNMFVLLSIGFLVERLLGNRTYLAVYCACGVAGSLASLWWNPETVSAGASGAIFGIYGALLGCLLRQRGMVPATVLRQLRNGVLIFIGYNLVYGLANKGVDLAAHLGGLLSGVIFGVVAARPLEPERRSAAAFRSSIQLAASVMLVGAGLLVLALQPGPLSSTRKLAGEGDATAQYRLGLAYAQGQGVAKDEEEAVKWFRQSAGQGHAGAQYNLGVMYAEGQDLPKSPIESYKWFLLAGAQGHEDSKRSISICERTLTAEQRAMGQKLAREWRPQTVAKVANPAAGR